MTSPKRILITHAGGGATTGVIRSWQLSGEDVFILGVDSDPYGIHRSEADENVLVPRVDDPDYLPILRDLIAEYEIDLFHSQIDSEVTELSPVRDTLGTRTLLPSDSAIRLLEDKMSSYERWKSAGLPVPGTLLVKNVDDLKAAFDEFGNKIWLRSIRGAGGAGSLPVDNLEMAMAWIDFQEGWGTFTASEVLSSKNFVWQSVWKKGRLLAAQSREDIRWAFSSRAPSGVTGIAEVDRTIDTPELSELGEQAVLAADPMPNGVYSVDFTADFSGVPKITEINAGRFPMTGYFLTRAGLNLPHVYLKAAFDEEHEQDLPMLSPLESDLVWVRGLDAEPVLTTMQEVERLKAGLARRIERVETDSA